MSAGIREGALRVQIPVQRAAAVVYAVGMFMSIMDTQIVNVALAPIARQFSATPTQVQWVVTGYLLSIAVSIPASGWLGDRFGTTRVYLVTVALFTIASALCAASDSLAQLVATRVIQGFGGGLMMPVGTTMLYRAYPPGRRVHVARTITAVTVIAPATAPVIGGVLVTALSWHWIFLVNVPFGLFAFVFGLVFLPRAEVIYRHHFDTAGFLFAGGGLAGLLYGVSEGAASRWGAPAAWAPAAGGIILLALFTRRSLRAPDPLLRLRLLDDRLFRRCCVLIGCSTSAFFGALVFIALYLQEGRGLSALTSGLTTFPEAVAIGLSAQVVSRLYPRVGPRRLLTAGFCGLAVVNGFLALAGAQTNLWLVRTLVFALGVSVSYVMLPTQAAAYARISAADTGQASAIFTALQRAASAFAIAILTLVLAVGGDHQVRAPVPAFHAVFAVTAGMGLLGAMFALGIHDSDAAGTMTREGKADHPDEDQRLADRHP
jgi:EmrB/QacA subfamily drug resistance transporter